MFLEIDEHFHMHRKSVDLCARLMNPVAWAYVQKLWAWACGNARNGDLTDCTPGAIEFIVGWSLGDGKFYGGCVAVGFIDEEKDTAGQVIRRAIHNWMKRTGAAIVRMDAAAAASKKRKKDWRDRQKGGDGTRDGTPPGRCDDVEDRLTDGTDAGTERGRNGEGTHQDKSSQGKSSQVKAKLDQGGDLSARPPDGPESRPGECWPAFEWLRRFGTAWAKHYGTVTYGRGDSDSKACGGLDYLLKTLSQEERLSAQQMAAGMFAAYLADKASAAAKHPFKWFAERFNGLRVGPAGQRRDSVIDAAIAKSGGKPYLPPPKEASGGSR